MRRNPALLEKLTEHLLHAQRRDLYDETVVRHGSPHERHVITPRERLLDGSPKKQRPASSHVGRKMVMGSGKRPKSAGITRRKVKNGKGVEKVENTVLQQNESDQAYLKSLMDKRVVPSSVHVLDRKRRINLKVSIVDEEKASKLQLMYKPKSETLTDLFNNDKLKVPIGLAFHSLSRKEYMEIEDRVDAELQHVKHSLMPQAFKKMRNQKLNELIFLHFEKLKCIEKGMERLDELLNGYESKRLQKQPLDILGNEDITELVMKDLVSREGVVLQTKERVKKITEESQKLTKQKHHILQDLRVWFKGHNIDVDTMKLNDISDMHDVMQTDTEDTQFNMDLVNSRDNIHKKRDKLNIIFSDYKILKEEVRQDEKKKYFNEFARKMQEIEENLVGNIQTLDAANMKIKLLLKKIVFLEEENEDLAEMKTEAVNNAQSYLQKFLQHKHLLQDITKRLNEPLIRQQVNANYILTGEYKDLNDSLEDSAWESSLPTIESLKDDKNTITSIELTEGAKDGNLWIVNPDEEDYERRDDIDFENFDNLPSHQLNPTEWRLKSYIDYLQGKICRLEYENVFRHDRDASTYESEINELYENIRSLELTIKEQRVEIDDLKDEIADLEDEVANPTQTEEVKNKLQQINDTRVERSSIEISISDPDSNPIKDNPRAVKKASKKADKLLKQMEDDQNEFLEQNKAIEEELTLLTETSLEIERKLASGEISMDDLSVEQRKAWRRENYLLHKRKTLLIKDISNLSQKQLHLKKLVDAMGKGRSISKSPKAKSPKNESSSLKSIVDKVKNAIAKTKFQGMKSHSFKNLAEQLQEDKKIKARAQPIFDKLTEDEIHMLYKSHNPDEFAATDEVLKKIDEIEDPTLLRNVCKLFALDRESLVEMIHGIHVRQLKFFECMKQLFSTAAVNLYSHTDFIKDWISHCRKTDRDISIKSVYRLWKLRPGHEDSSHEYFKNRRTRMSTREELKEQTQYVISSESELQRKKNSPIALCRSVLGILVKTYFHFKLFKRRKMRFSSPVSSGRLSATRSSRKSSSKMRKKRKSKQATAVTKSLQRMEKHQETMKQRWEEKRQAILIEQRNRFAGYSLNQDGSYALADKPPSLSDPSVDSQRTFRHLSPRESKNSSKHQSIDSNISQSSKSPRSSKSRKSPRSSSKSKKSPRSKSKRKKKEKATLSIDLKASTGELFRSIPHKDRDAPVSYQKPQKNDPAIPPSLGLSGRQVSSLGRFSLSDGKFSFPDSPPTLDRERKSKL